MKALTKVLILSLLMLLCKPHIYAQTSSMFYPIEAERIKAKPHTVYYINPNTGNDNKSGIKSTEAWKTFKNVNRLILTKGNSIKVLAAGTFKESLFLIGRGTEEAPITLEFASGKYDFFPENAFAAKFQISNTNDAPDSLKSVAFYFLNSEQIHIKGHHAEIVFRGKTIMLSMNHCTNMHIEDLSFDYHRPTVSEMTAIAVTEQYTDVLIHPDFIYEIKDGSLIWIGENWAYKAQKHWQAFNPKTDEVSRESLNTKSLHFSELSKGKVRIHYTNNPGFKEGIIYQNRDIFRDYAAFFIQNSQNIFWKDIHIFFMHGMGFVSQFCDNITFDSLSVKPKENAGRSCATWADILHFSSCKGQINIQNSFLSAANDDAINVHGTHLRIIEQISDKGLKVAFMHPQTFGFMAFHKGDSIEFIRANTLLPYAKNKVSKVKKLNEKEFELILEKAIPKDINQKDVLENISWTADVTIKNNTITHIPTRGVLITTRGKVMIEDNQFIKTHMSAILISDDANSWYESGYVRDVTIKNNAFIYCGSPVINIHPENSSNHKENPVHKNISITGNTFKLSKGLLLSAKSTGNITLSNNLIEGDKTSKLKKLIKLKSCPDSDINDNKSKNHIQ